VENHEAGKWHFHSKSFHSSPFKGESQEGDGVIILRNKTHPHPALPLKGRVICDFLKVHQFFNITTDYFMEKKMLDKGEKLLYTVHDRWSVIDHSSISG